MGRQPRERPMSWVQATDVIRALTVGVELALQANRLPKGTRVILQGLAVMGRKALDRVGR